jgi:Protein of unknown function (DUF3500)
VGRLGRARAFTSSLRPVDDLNGEDEAAASAVGATDRMAIDPGGHMKDWTEFGLRRLPVMSSRTRVGDVPGLEGLLDPLRAAIAHELASPLNGVTADGHVAPDLFPVRSTGVSTAPILDAALAFVESLDAAERDRVVFPLEAGEWRMWFNVHMNFARHGLMLEDISQPRRDAALELMRATLSHRGFDQARNIMRLNGLLVEITGSTDEYGEWPYFISIFGTPSPEEPWGWQLDGHHLNVNCVVIGDEVVLTPTFMGSEPTKVTSGRLAGTEVLQLEQQVGLDLIRSLGDEQLARAVLYPSILPGALPDHLNDMIDGRMSAGAFKDNAVLPYVGVSAEQFSDAQRQLLRQVIASYVGWAADAHAAVKMSDVDALLDETWFAWMGGTGPEDPFYYRVHSPVVLIEFDHHPGVVFDNAEPTHHHIHTIIRTPNGGDYGADLLRQHHERYDHSQGRHD